MAVDARVVTVSTTAKRLDAGGARSGSFRLSLKNNSGLIVYLGSADVTAADGYPIANNQSIDLDLGRGESLYGIVTLASGPVVVIESGV